MNTTEYFDQDNVWLAKGNRPIPLEFIDREYAQNIVGWLERHVDRFYVMAMLEALSSEFVGEFVGEYDDEMRFYNAKVMYWVERDHLEWLRTTRLYQAFKELAA